jgi:Holliday junction resolvasome RuvABC endonuclease subunit
MRVLARDAATGITGYAIYDDKKLVDYGTFSTDELMDSTSRINEVKHWLLDMINYTKPDAIGIENI